MVRASEAAPTEADGRHLKVATVLLDHKVGSGLRDAEERVERVVDRHRGRDAAVELVVLRQFEPLLELDERQGVRPIAVDLVGRTENERGVRLVVPRRLEEVKRSVRVYSEVGLRIARCPVM
jgi:hypothetical protein